MPGETADPVQVSLEVWLILQADVSEVAQGRERCEVLSTGPVMMHVGDLQLGVWRGPAFLGDSCLLSYYLCPF